MGGCGCGGTVQYAPPACNPNFPTTCSALGQGSIVRVVGEDSASCKYTVPTLASNSLLFYNASTALTSWADGTDANPIKIATPDTQSTAESVKAIQGTLTSGQLVKFSPASTPTKATFPYIAASDATKTASWGTIDSIIPNNGVVYKASGTVSEAPLGTEGQVLTMTGGVPAFSSLPTNAFIDARSVNIFYAGSTSLNVAFGQLVVNNAAGNSISVKNSGTYTLNLSTNSLPNGLDTGSLAASTYYYVFAIYNSTTSSVSTLASLNPTAPTLPTGYTYFRLIGLFRTNSSSQIDPLYNQNGRAVNLGQTANVVVLSKSYPDSTNKYWSGSITYAPYAYVDKAFFRFSLVGAATQIANVVISNIAAGSTGASYQNLVNTSEVYGAFIVTPYTTGGVNSTYSTTTCVIPNNSNSFYNIYTTAQLSSGDSFALQISGYELSFL